MNKIERLIKELCPNGVEYYYLKDVLVKSSGTRITATQMKELHKEDGLIKIFAGGKTFAMVNPGDIPEKDVIHRPSIIVKSRGIIEFVYYTKPFSHKAEFWSYFSDNKDINIKFVYYLLKNSERNFNDKASVMQMPQISSKDTQNFRIPIPPLEIQEEIVKILDKFTDYVTELTTELTLRQKQYNYYRDKLLTFEGEEVVWKTLNEISTNMDNLRRPVTKTLRNDGIYPYYGASGIVDYVGGYIFEGNFLLVSEDGANLKVRNTPIAFSISGKNWVNNHAHVLKFNNLVTQKFVEYYLNSIDLSNYISGAAQPKLNQKNLNMIKIPHPTLEKQEQIVSVLNTFEKLCNDIINGLPKEIELRQKQYEYYRDKLLSFD